MAKKRAPKSRPRAGAVIGALLGVACLVVASAAALRSSGPSGASAARDANRRSTSEPKAAASVVSSVESGPAATATDSAAGWRYDAVVRRNLFMPLVTSQAAAKPGALPPLKPMPVDAFQLREMGPADGASAAAPAPPTWIYAGYATVNGNPMAIVEKSDTKQGQFLTVGETLDGATVSDISPQAIKLTRGAETTELKISDAFTATPLNEPPKPQAAPSQGRGGRGGFPGGGFFRRMMPVLQNNPELADQARRLMEGINQAQQAGGGSGPPAVSGGGPQGGRP
jgi:hypothetical protein